LYCPVKQYTIACQQRKAKQKFQTIFNPVYLLILPFVSEMLRNCEVALG